MEIESESATRLAESGEEGVSSKLAVLHFESPAGKDAKKKTKKAPARKAKSADPLAAGPSCRSIPPPRACWRCWSRWAARR